MVEQHIKKIIRSKLGIGTSMKEIGPKETAVSSPRDRSCALMMGTFKYGKPNDINTAHHTFSTYWALLVGQVFLKSSS